MNSLNTMLLIANTFIGLCDEMPLKKVSISDIIQKTGKNRKTFYYHFENKDSLIAWIFRYDLGKRLTETFPEKMLIYEPSNQEGSLEFPYYILQKSGIRSLDHSAFFECFGCVIEAKRHFYTQALIDNNPYSLRNYLYNLYLPALRKDVDTILSNRSLPEQNIQYLAEFYACAFLYYYIRKCDQVGVDHLTGQAGPFANIIHSSIEMEINEAQSRRKL